MLLLIGGYNFDRGILKYIQNKLFCKVHFSNLIAFDTNTTHYE